MARFGKIYREIYGDANIKTQKEDKRKKFYQYDCPDGSTIIGWNETGTLTPSEINRRCSRRLPKYQVNLK